jgi:hypothetical protein
MSPGESAPNFRVETLLSRYESAGWSCFAPLDLPAIRIRLCRQHGTEPKGRGLHPERTLRTHWTPVHGAGQKCPVHDQR